MRPDGVPPDSEAGPSQVRGLEWAWESGAMVRSRGKEGRGVTGPLVPQLTPPFLSLSIQPPGRPGAAGPGASRPDLLLRARPVGLYPQATSATAIAPPPTLAAALHHLKQVDESGGGHLDASALATVHRDAAGLPT